MAAKSIYQEAAEKVIAAALMLKQCKASAARARTVYVAVWRECAPWSTVQKLRSPFAKKRPTTKRKKP